MNGKKNRSTNPRVPFSGSNGMKKFSATMVPNAPNFFSKKVLRRSYLSIVTVKK